MKCKHCGTQYLENDIFCGECGKKIGALTDTPVKTVKMSLIWSIVGAALLGLIFFCFISMAPQNYELEAYDLAYIIDSGDTEEYLNDNLKVHGYLYRNDLETGVHGLYTDVNDEHIVVFEDRDTLIDELGSGSEIIVNGKLESWPDTDTLIVCVDSIEVIESTSLMYEIDSIDTLLSYSQTYSGKTISVQGNVDSDGNNIYFWNSDYSKIVYLSGEANLPIGEIYVEGLYYVNADGDSIIEVTHFEDRNSNEELPHFESITELIAMERSYIDSYVSVEGWIEGFGGSLYMYEDGANIRLDGLTEEDVYRIRGGYITITGCFFYDANNYEYALCVEDIVYL